MTRTIDIPAEHPFEPESLLAEHPILLAAPVRLSENARWHQHIPFAFWCVAALRPRVIVELGTQEGDSYAAFCQAVDTLGLATKCFSIEMRPGNRPALLHASDALFALRDHHDRRYGSFSTLLRADLEDATRRFENGSVDLLNIASTRNADEGRACYKQWLPKLSPQAVVLFHDIAIRHDDFHVHEIWTHLSAAHPSLAFRHGHGLGALAPGEYPPEAFLRLADLTPDRHIRLERLFHYLGRVAGGQGGRQRIDKSQDPRRSPEFTLIERELKHLTGQLAASRDAQMQLEARLRDQELALQRRDAAFRAAMQPPAALHTPSQHDVGRPIASIVIPVHDGWHHTISCLERIRATPSAVSHEIIVVDDHSADGTFESLQSRTDIRLLRNPRNLGYLLSCNQGARHASGQYLVLLNNDTLVLPGWLDELIGTFADVPQAGLVGARLIYPDCRLQEAGGIVWQDGSGWNYGRGDDADRPEYSYRRDVDYCSAACVAVPLALWQALGGFDEDYAPAYWEDTDLAFRLRAAGHRVLYQPLACVIHAEGGSHGTDLTRGIKAHQFVNQRRFFERWAETLADHGEPARDLPRALNRRTRWRVLVIDDLTPRPDRDAGSVNTIALMMSLQNAGYQVVFYADREPVRVPGYTENLERAGIECLVTPYNRSLREHLEIFGGTYDLILAIRVTNAGPHLQDFRRLAPQARIILHTADLHFLRLEREAALTGKAADFAGAAEIRTLELGTIAAVDCTVVHSSAEQALLAELIPQAAIYCFPWVQDVAGTDVGFDDRSGVMFLGGYRHRPNVDAVEFFASQVLPLLLEAIPDLVFYVVGSHPPPELLALQSKHLVVTDQVADLRPWMDRCRVSVAPLRYGAGIKGKVAAAMSYGLPVAATPIAIEGTELTPEQDVLVGQGPAELAAQIVRLYTDRELWRRLSDAGLDFVGRHYSRDQGDRHLEAILKLADAPV